jgi:hypothetical protein
VAERQRSDQRSRVIAAYAVLAILLAVAMFDFRGIDYRSPSNSGMDLVKYRAMAAAAPSISAHAPAPYARRIAGPWLAGILPMSDPLAFRLLNTLAAALLMAGLFTWMRAEGVSVEVATLMTGVLAFSKTTLGFQLYDYFQLNDTFALALLCWSAVAVMRRRWLLASCLILVSVPFRETLLVMVPAVLWLAWESRGTRRTKLVCAVGACLVIGEYALLLSAIPAVGGVSLAHGFRMNVLKYAHLGNLFRLLFNTYVPLALIPLVFWRRSLAWLNARRWLVVLCLATVLSSNFGGDTERLLVPVFLVLLVMCAHLVEQVSHHASLLAGAALVAAVCASLGRVETQVRVPLSASIALSVGCTFAVAALWMLLRQPSESLPGQSSTF